MGNVFKIVTIVSLQKCSATNFIYNNSIPEKKQSSSATIISTEPTLTYIEKMNMKKKYMALIDR